MKKLLLMLILSVSTGLVVVSCTKEDSTDVNQDKIYAEYELFYNKNEDKTYASAVFKFSNAFGTQLELESPSQVKFNSDVIPFDGTFAYYRKEYAGLVTSGTFTFTDSDGNVYTNQVSLPSVIANPTIDTIHRTWAFTYNWTGNTLNTNESASLVIGNNANPFNLQLFLQSATGAGNFVLPLTQLNQLPIGMSYTQLDKQIETAAPNVTSAGGKIRGKYRALNGTLYID